jgi:phosphoserine phosphatase
MIGEHKATAVDAWLRKRPEINPERCFAYADDESDIEMLACVGKPRVVGDDPVLSEYVRVQRANGRALG